jgi:hypothetical protein
VAYPTAEHITVYSNFLLAAKNKAGGDPPAAFFFWDK